MPEAELEPDIVLEPEPSPVVLVFDPNGVNEDDNETILQAIFDINEIIELLLEHKVDSLDSIKGVLLNIDVIIEYFQKKYGKTDVYSQLIIFLSQEKQKILDLINSHASQEDVSSELQLLIKKIEEYYQKTLNPSKEPELNPNPVYQDKEFRVDPLVLSKIDGLYAQLYEAVSKKDVKKETLYRGRIIRELRKHQDEIDKAYQKVQFIEDISKLLNNNSIEQIRDYLKKIDNPELYSYFEHYLESLDDFLPRFVALCNNPDIMKILYYHFALKKELNIQGKKLNDRYSKEFLDKKADIVSVATILPTAVGLSIQKLANTIRELKEAKTNRKKRAKILELLKDSGKVIATPIVYAGKFAVNNWYVLYKLISGYHDIKSDDKDILEPTPAKEEKIVKDSNDSPGDINPEENVNVNKPIEKHRHPSIVKPKIVGPLEEDVPSNVDLNPRKGPVLKPEPKGDSDVHIVFDPEPSPSEVLTPQHNPQPVAEPVVEPLPASDPMMEPNPAPEPEVEPNPLNVGDPVIDPVTTGTNEGPDFVMPHIPAWGGADPNTGMWVNPVGHGGIDGTDIAKALDSLFGSHIYDRLYGGGTKVNEGGSSHRGGKC